ncbi:phage tail tape measure protein [Chromobacterium sphagni]|uniref:Phage tail tape measure protein n=1 Tax=Chromobacterium sphagni TaxID=1903179 RepID=A0A1S1WT27_9NEIS|nr:phage tail tape measure protein [Chromobacterium sphagni]OHX10255.1 phage tail tape measure protein [Chromobacterium sphagni]
MANNMLVSVAIGAVLQGSYLAAFAGAKRSMEVLDATTKQLKGQQDALGQAMKRAMGTLSDGSLAALNRDYERLGRAVDALRLKQEKLAASMARGGELKAARQESWSGMKESAATAVAVGAPIFGSAKQAAKFEAGLRDITITGNLTKQQELQVGAAIRQAALTTNQGHAAILDGVGTLVAAGMDAQEAGKRSKLLGRVSTATNADMKDVASMVYSFTETLGIKTEDGLKEAFNRAAYGGKLGRFELKDMAKALPEMTAAFAAKGIKGQQAVTQIVASLEVGREGAGSGDEAVTNLRNWLSHMNAKPTIDAYKKAGVDYQGSMQNLVAGGFSSYEASLEIANNFIKGKGDGFMKQWKAAGAKGDQEAQRKLMESFGLNEVFQDIQTINHLLSMRQGWDKYKENKQKMGSEEALGSKDKPSTIDVDYAKRVETAEKAWQRFSTQVTDVAITIGNTLLPSISSTLDELTPVIKSFGAWAEQNPGMLRGIIGMVGGVVALRTALFGLKFLGNFMFLAPANSVATAWTVLSTRVTLIKALLAGGSSRFSLLLQFFGMSAERAGRLTAVLGKLGGGAVRLGRLLGSSLLTVGRTVLWLGRAVMMNPIGLAVMAIAGAAYLIYRYWEPIKAFFGKVWSAVDGVFKRYPILNYIFPIIGIPRLIIANWSRIKTFFSGLWEGIKQSMTSLWGWMKMKVASWIVFWLPVIRFAGELPGKFLTAGKDLVMGLVNGIKAKIGAAKEAIVGLGKDIKGWFASTLGIKSPSRVFMGFGDNIAQGAAIGIDRSAGGAVRASGAMAKATANAWGKPRLQTPAIQDQAQALQTMQLRGRDVGPTRIETFQRLQAGERGNAVPAGKAPQPMAIHFNPVIHLPAGTPEATKGALQETLKLSIHELEQMIRRIMAQQDRRAYN